MKQFGRKRAFSLIEVVIAVGIFAVAVATILAMLPSTTKQAAGSRDIQTAARLPDAVRVELQRLAPNMAAFASFAASPRNLVATRDGTAVRVLDADITREQYFLIEVAPFTDAALRYDAAKPILVLRIRVSWPYQPMGPNGTLLPATEASNRDQFSFNISLRP